MLRHVIESVFVIQRSTKMEGPPLSPVQELAYLEIYMGPMCSGKSLQLLKRLSDYSVLGLPCMYINSALDTRSDKPFSTNYSAPIGLPRDVMPIKATRLEEVSVVNARVLAVDEAHFFPDLLDTIRSWLDAQKIILIAGLNGDHQMRPFGQLLQLIPLADEIYHFKAHCRFCLQQGLPYRIAVTKAPFTLRLANETDQILIGGTESYAPVCRFHHWEGRGVV